MTVEELAAVLATFPANTPVVVLDAHEHLVEIEDCYLIPDESTTHFDPQIVPRHGPVVRIV